MKTFKLVKEKNSFQIHWEKKSINEKRDEKGNEYLEIEGYASTKDRDRGGDVVEPQAFEKAIKGYMTNPIVLLQHKHDKPIGVVTDAKVDNNGLYIKANITENTDNVMSAIRNGVLRTFSIGYWLKEGDYEVNEFIDDNGVADYTTTIKNLELYEISVVSVPMNAYALMKSIEDCFEVEEVKEEKNKETEEEKTETVETKVFDESENQENDSQEVENTDNEWKENTEKSLTNEEEETEQEEVEEEKTEDVKEEVKENEGEIEKVEDTEGGDVENAISDNSGQEVAENANIESSEVVENSENVSETETNGSETNSVEVKTMGGISQKSFQIGEKELEEMIEKRLEAKLLVKEKEVENLKTELVKLKDVLKTTIQVLGEIDGAVRNTVIKTGATYSQVAKRQSARSDVVKQAQKSL